MDTVSREIQIFGEMLKQISLPLNLFVFGSCFRTLAVILFQIFR